MASATDPFVAQLARNAGSAFDTSDMDHDGYLDHHDMSVAAEALCDRLGLADPSPQRDLVLSAYERSWRSAAEVIDFDGDGRISRDDYIQHVHSPHLDRTAFVAQVVWPITDALWDALDADGDEKLNRPEYLRLWAAFDVEGPSAREAFEMLDANRDGRLSKDEFAQAMYDFYYKPERATVPILGRP
ncbi:Ca2+-binding protein, EF-hand superfamily [Sinosporangium album]|uniref:Ca2+-binding protein, EF-hand superfamily n=1 Tax=Sinosporangium album TaxID=504805 RepID=A0A1G8JPL3_9ACTN|nr:EF-hand domain-containing protein [Sinosporangium album]SDI33158.1 Ca2+-binding protein, EF-hand superfamily [Sinosporangium album]